MQTSKNNRHRSASKPATKRPVNRPAGATPVGAAPHPETPQTLDEQRLAQERAETLAELDELRLDQKEAETWAESLEAHDRLKTILRPVVDDFLLIATAKERIAKACPGSTSADLEAAAAQVQELEHARTAGLRAAARTSVAAKMARQLAKIFAAKVLEAELGIEMDALEAEMALLGPKSRWRECRVSV